MAKQYNPWTGFLEDTATKANDEKPTIDKAIRNCDSNVKLVKTVAKKNGYAIHIVSGEYGERIVLTFPGENYNNPHMWLGSNTPSNMSKAQEMLLGFAAIAKDSKCKTAVDKAILSCDVNKAEGFKIYNAYVRNDTLYIEYEDLLYGNGKKEKESFTRTEAKKLLTDPWNTWLGTSKMVVKQFAG